MTRSCDLLARNCKKRENLLVVVCNVEVTLFYKTV